MAFGFTDMTPEGKRYFAKLKQLAEMEVAVGFQGDGGDYEGGASVAEVAAYNELGTSDTPARPFMRNSFENHESELRAACERVNQIIASGGSLEEALNQLGVVAKALIQEEIVDGEFEPNAASTIKKKGSDKPLIDTGTMRQSVTYVVRRAGAGE